MNLDQTHYVVIDADCRCSTCREWIRELGADHVAILDPRPVEGRDRQGRPSKFVQADVGRLTPRQLDRVARGMALKFGLEVARARRMLLDPAHGFPIRLGPGRVVCTDPDTGRAQLRFRGAALDRMGVTR